MGTLDRYIVKQYLLTFFFSVLICTLISVAIDFSDKVSSFIERPCTKWEIAQYYAGFMLHMSGLLLPMYVLIAVVFFTSRLAFNSEILSILNAGVSFWRLMRPYLVGACIVAGLHLFLNHWAIPTMNKKRLWFERTYVWTDQEKSRSSNAHFLLGSNQKVFVRGYNKTSQTASGLKLEHFENNHVTSILEAENATYRSDRDRWEITNYTVRTFDGLRESFTRFAAPKDTFLALSPQDFVWFSNQNEGMTTPELLAAIRRDRARGLSNIRSFEIELARRTADAFTIFILTIIGLAVAGRKVRGGMGLHLAMGIGIGSLYVLLSKFAVSFASSGQVSVLLGMWIPNLVFGAVAIWLVSKAQK